MSFVLRMPGWAVFAAVLAILAVFAAALMWGRIDLMRGSELEGAARYYPADIVAFGWFSARPRSAEQRELVARALELVDEDGAALPSGMTFEDALLERFGLKMDDVKKWAGPEFSFGLLHQRGIFMGETDDFAWVGAAQMRDAALARQSLNAALGDYDRRWEGGYEIRSPDAGGDVWVGLSDRTLFAASSAQALARVTYRAEGERLWDSGDFQAAREAMVADRAGSIYVSLSAADELLDGVSGEDAAPGWEEPAGASWGAAAIYLEPGALRVSAVSPAALDELSPAAIGEGDLGIYPADAALVGAFGFDPDLENWRRYLSRYRLGDEGARAIGSAGGGEYMGAMVADGFGSMTLSEGLNAALAMGTLMLGINLEWDFLAHLSGRASVGIWEREGGAVFGGTLAHKEGADGDLIAAIERASANLEELGLPSAPYDGRFGRGVAFGDTGDDGAIGVFGGRVAAANDKRALDEMASGGGAILNDEGYQEMVAKVGMGRELMIYGDFERLESILGITYSGVKQVGRFGVSDYGSDGEYQRIEAAVTIFPDEDWSGGR